MSRFFKEVEKTFSRVDVSGLFELEESKLFF